MFNEVRGAERCVKEVCAALRALNAPAHMLVVDDGSTDGTAELVQRLTVEFPWLSVIRHSHNDGYGAAITSGAEYAINGGYKYALFMDSDLTNDPADIPAFVAEMERDVDVIKATRYSAGGGMRGVLRHRVVISTVGNWVARQLFRLPLHDCTNGFRAVKTSVLAQLRLTESGFAVITEELYQASFVAETYAEVPTILLSRGATGKPSSFDYRPGVFYHYLRWAILRRLGVRPLHLR